MPAVSDKLKERVAPLLDRVLYAYVIAVGLVEIWHLTFPFIFLERVAHFSVISPALAAFGFGLFVLMLLFGRERYFRKNYSLWIALFVGAMVVSSLALMNFGTFGNGTSSSIVSNVKLIIWQIDFMLVIYPFCSSMGRRRIGRLIRIVYWATAALFIPCLIVSFYQFAHSIGYDAIYGLTAVSRQGFQGGRLFGVLMGVFCSGSMTAILFFVSALLGYKAKSAASRLAYTLIGIAYLAYSVLSGARAVMVGAVFAVVFVYFLFALRHYKGTKGGILNIVATTIVVLSVSTCAYMGAGTLLEVVPQLNADSQEENETQEEESGDAESIERDEPSDPVKDADAEGGSEAGLPEGAASESESVEGVGKGVSGAEDVDEDKDFLKAKPDVAKDPGEVVVKYRMDQDGVRRDAEEYTIVASYLDGNLLLGYVGGTNPPFDEQSLNELRDDPNATFTVTALLNREDGKIVVHRPDADADSEVSNGRFDIWKSYLTVFLSSPRNVLFGMSPGYYMPAIYDKYKDDHLYIVDYFLDNHPGAISQGLIYDVHNTYLGVLVKVGLVGFAPLVAFLVLLARGSLRAFFRSRQMDAEMMCAFGVVCFLMASCFFDNDLFLYTSSNSFAFWVAAGFLAYCSREHAEGCGDSGLSEKALVEGER